MDKLLTMVNTIPAILVLLSLNLVTLDSRSDSLESLVVDRGDGQGGRFMGFRDS